MRNIFQKSNSFYIIFIVFLVFFSFIMFLSIPALFDYKKIEKNIKESVESSYPFKIENLTEIEYRFFPSPHLFIKNSEIYLGPNPDKIVGSTENLKIYISIFKLYNFKQIEIKKIDIKNTNFNFDKFSLNLFLKYLNSKKTKKLFIKNSKIFYYDNNKEVLVISILNKLNFFTNDKTNQSKLKINGNLFDTDFDLVWSKDFKNLNKSNFRMKFKNPNITIENFLNNDKKLKNGKIKISFLSDETEIDYNYNDENFNIKTLSNNQFSINGKINLKPFYFNLTSSINDTKIKNLINNILLTYFNYKENIHKNLNGKLNIRFNNLNNAYFTSGFLDFNFADSKLEILNNKLKIKNIGNIYMRNNLFYENKGEIYFVADLQINIKNKDEFHRRFSIPIQKRGALNTIYATIEKNIDKDNFAISNFSINEEPDFDFTLDNIINSEKDYFDNFQKFRNVIKKKFSNIN